MSKTDSDRALRDHVLALLRGGEAHAEFDRAIAGLPADLRSAHPEGVPHTPWRLIEHMRIAQWDILEFSRNPDHESPAWPEGYWPEGDAPPTARAWQRSVSAFHADRRAMEALVADPASDLLAPFPWGQGQTLLREALLVCDHTAYHLGQLIELRRVLGAWAD